MKFQTICWIKLRFRISNCLFDHFFPTWINFLETNLLNLISLICIFSNWCFWHPSEHCMSTPFAFQDYGRKLRRNPEIAPSKSCYFFENPRQAHTKFWQSEIGIPKWFCITRSQWGITRVRRQRGYSAPCWLPHFDPIHRRSEIYSHRIDFPPNCLHTPAVSSASLLAWNTIHSWGWI